MSNHHIKPSNYFWPLLALCLPVTIACIDIMAVSVALNNIMHDFASDIGKIQWLISGYTLGTGVFLITIGKLADIYGRRKLLLLGIFLFAFSSLLAALSPSIYFLIISRFLQGVAGATIMTAVLSIVTHQFAPHKRGKIIAIWGLSLGLGASLGPLIGGLLLYIANWQAIFLINIPICLFSYYLVKRYIPESKDEKTLIKIDWLETFLLTSVLFTFIVVLAEGNFLGWTSNFIIITSLVFITSLILFIFIERKKMHPVFDFSLFKQANFFGGTLCGFFSYYGLYAFLFIFNLYLQQGYGMSPLSAGFMMIPATIGFAFGAKIFGIFVNQLHNKYLLQIAFIIGMLATLTLMLISHKPQIWQFIVIFFIFGSIISVINTAATMVATEHVPPHKAGIASGIIFTIRWLGGSVGVVLITLVYQAHGLGIACLSLAVVAMIAFICASVFIQQNNGTLTAKT